MTFRVTYRDSVLFVNRVMEVEAVSAGDATKIVEKMGRTVLAVEAVTSS